MAETNIFYWTDRAERAYVRLRQRGGHYNVEWGVRDPPGGDNHLEQGEVLRSEQEVAIRAMLDQVRASTDEPSEVATVERKLRAALLEANK